MTDKGTVSGVRQNRQRSISMKAEIMISADSGKCELDKTDYQIKLIISGNADKINVESCIERLVLNNISKFDISGGK